MSGQTNIPRSRQCEISWSRVLRIPTAAASDVSTLLIQAYMCMCRLSQQRKTSIKTDQIKYKT